MPQQRRLPYQFPSLVVKSDDFPDQQKTFRAISQLVEQIKRYFITVATAVNENIAISGTTADRPTTQLSPGQMYFDTTLNRPIWRNAANNGWVKADGTAA